MHHSTTRLCSSCDSVGLSPVVPTGTRPLVPSAICHSTISRNAFSSSEPFLNGVTSAVKEPRKLVLAVMARLLHKGPTTDPLISGRAPRRKPQRLPAEVPEPLTRHRFFPPANEIFRYHSSINLA